MKTRTKAVFAAFVAIVVSAAAYATPPETIEVNASAFGIPALASPFQLPYQGGEGATSLYESYIGDYYVSVTAATDALSTIAINGPTGDQFNAQTASILSDPALGRLPFTDVLTASGEFSSGASGGVFGGSDSAWVASPSLPDPGGGVPFLLTSVMLASRRR